MPIVAIASRALRSQGSGRHPPRRCPQHRGRRRARASPPVRPALARRRPACGASRQTRQGGSPARVSAARGLGSPVREPERSCGNTLASARLGGRARTRCGARGRRRFPGEQKSGRAGASRDFARGWPTGRTRGRWGASRSPGTRRAPASHALARMKTRVSGQRTGRAAGGRRARRRRCSHPCLRRLPAHSCSRAAGLPGGTGRGRTPSSKITVESLGYCRTRGVTHQNVA